MKMRYITNITEEQVEHLRKVSRHSRNHRERERAKAILLSYKGYNVTVLSDIFEVSRGTITNWLDAWEERGVFGLKDLPKQLSSNSFGEKTLIFN
jgi:transposase-like protein